MTTTTNTKEPIGRDEKPQAIPSLAEADLRDYFAAKAMQALISNPQFDPEDIPGVPEASYGIADIMIAERNMP